MTAVIKGVNSLLCHDGRLDDLKLRALGTMENCGDGNIPDGSYPPMGLACSLVALLCDLYEVIAEGIDSLKLPDGLDSCGKSTGYVD